MHSPDGYALLAIFLATLIHAFFTLTETSLVTVRSARLQQIISEGGRDAATATRAQNMMRQPARIVATVQVGVTLSSFTVAALAAVTLAPDFAPLLHRVHVPHDLRASATLLVLLAALWTIVVGELVPRAFAQRHPEGVALRVQGLLRVFMFGLSGLAGFALGLSNLLVKPFGLNATFAAPMITEEELRVLLEASAKSGAIEEDEKQIIRNVISFGDTDVRQVMTPRIDIKAADISASTPALLQLVVDSGHSRIPVYEGSVDAIVGIIHAKDLLAALSRGETHLNLRQVMRQPLLVSENKRVDDLLDEFRRAKVQIAVVQDEYGGTAGLVTLEDLLEELVGEIHDEYDTVTPSVQVIGPDESLVDARMAITDLNEQMGLNLPHEDFDTVGGLVFGLFGRLPRPGEAVRADGIDFIVEKTGVRRIEQVRLHKRDSVPSEDNAVDSPT
ncbi:MAG: hemolysin family protein [Armatimonadota bacterium]|nr:hemolysin family protein [Armatimonadota bacterium]